MLTTVKQLVVKPAPFTALAILDLAFLGTLILVIRSRLTMVIRAVLFTS